MANERSSGGQVDLQLSNLIWQLKLQAERQLSMKESLRVLVSDPAKLEELLVLAQEAGDDSMKKLVADIREMQRGPKVVVQKKGVPLAVVIGIAVLVVGIAAAYFIFKPAPPPPAVVMQKAAEALPVSKLFRLHGSNTVGEKLAPALVEGWLKSKRAVDVESKTLAADEHLSIATVPGATSRPAVEIFAHGSATAFKDLAAAATDLGMASRRVKPEEATQLLPIVGDMTSSNAEHVVGLDGLAVIVNSDNPVQSLTIEQVARIFSGDITNWSQVGGRDAPIALFARDDKSGTYDTFKALVLEVHKVKLLDAAKRFESSSELSDAVAADINGIGFIGLPYVKRARALGIAADGGGRPIVPTAFTVGTEDYPLSRRLYFYSPTIGAKPEVTEFVEFALSEAGQEIVNGAGFVSQNLHTEKPVIGADAPPEYSQLVAGAERLSLNFRFISGSNNLDNKAQRDLLRLVDYLLKNPGRSLILVGFADSIGNPEINRSLSLARAKAVDAVLQARGIYPREVRGFGSAIPVASNDSDAGREKNRRVEVWLK